MSAGDLGCQSVLRGLHGHSLSAGAELMERRQDAQPLSHRKRRPTVV